MLDRTRLLWDKQRELVGDRQRLFGAVADAVDAETVLYAGSYVDITPAFIWPDVTFVDSDRRANQFFSDEQGIEELLIENDAGRHAVRFLHSDYSEPFAVDDRSVDLLISLYAGFVSEHCTRYLRVGGTLLVNGSHGDAAMASIDDRFRLSGVVSGDAGSERVEVDDLDRFLVPKRAVEITVESLHQSGRGVVYTTSPFAYLFQRVS